MQTKQFTTILLILLTLSLVSPGAKAQDDLAPGLKNWWSFSLGTRLSDNLTLRSSHLLGMNMMGTYKAQFYQTNLGVEYRIARKWRVEGGLAHSQFYGKKLRVFHRLYARGTYRQDWGRLDTKQQLRAEWHFPQLTKFRYRLIWSQRWRYRIKGAPWRMSPFIGTRFDYYLNGKSPNGGTIEPEEGEEGEENEFDDEGERGINGLHRARLTLGVQFRPVKRLYISPYVTFQKEFNLPWQEETGLNMETESGKTFAPFNNYVVLGLSVSYTLDFRDKGKKRRK